MTSESRKVIGITGGSGYIGSNLARHFSQSFDVKLLDILPPRGDLPKSVKFSECDVTDYGSVGKGLKDVDLVIHTSIIQIPRILKEKNLAFRVNVTGTENVAKAVATLERPKGMILTSSWHTIGERGLDGVVSESFGYRPDKVEERARLYTLSKIIQESVVRFYDETSDKTFGIVRMGTVLGEGMPPDTAANLFIEKGLKGEPLTPYKHSIHRPMFFADINDTAKAYVSFAKGILDGRIPTGNDSFHHIINVYLPQPITVLELANIVAKTIERVTDGRIRPKVEIVDKGVDSPFTAEDKDRVWGDMRKSREVLQAEPKTSVEESIERIVRARLNPEVLVPSKI
jgi:nucleoside-diphosphate-sugar epimerase